MDGGVRFSLGALLALAVLMAGTVGLSLARVTASDDSTGGFATDVLAPATDLTATDGATITLDWTATSKTWAAGYTIWRALSADGPYAQVDTVTPRTTVTYVDAPPVGTHFYQVRAYYQDWESVAAGPVSATAGTPLVTTGWRDCLAASNAADTSGAGDNNGYQANADRACAPDGLFAQDAGSGTGGSQSCGTGATPDAWDRHRWWGYDLGLPDGHPSTDRGPCTCGSTTTAGPRACACSSPGMAERPGHRSSPRT
jgi:hypothetical protein